MEILTVVLKEEHRRQGLYLTEDVHTVYLKRGQQTLARFNASHATIEEIQKEADKHLVAEGEN